MSAYEMWLCVGCADRPPTKEEKDKMAGYENFDSDLEDEAHDGIELRNCEICRSHEDCAKAVVDGELLWICRDCASRPEQDWVEPDVPF